MDSLATDGSGAPPSRRGRCLVRLGRAIMVSRRTTPEGLVRGPRGRGSHRPNCYCGKILRLPNDRFRPPASRFHSVRPPGSPGCPPSKARSGGFLSIAWKGRRAGTRMVSLACQTNAIAVQRLVVVHGYRHPDKFAGEFEWRLAMGDRRTPVAADIRPDHEMKLKNPRLDSRPPATAPSIGSVNSRVPGPVGWARFPRPGGAAERRDMLS